MKKVFGISAIVAVVVTLVAGAVLMTRLAQFRAAVEQLKTNGFPVSIADLQLTNSEEGQHSLGLLKRLMPPLESFDVAMWNVDKDPLNRPVDEKMIENFEDLVAQHSDLFPWLEELSMQTEIGFDVEGDSQEFLDALLKREILPRSCARVLAWKTRILAAQGKPDEAVLNALQIFRIARLFDRDPMLVAQLVTYAARGIAIESVHQVIVDHTLTGETREQLNQELEMHDALAGYKHSLLGERAFGIEAVSDMGLLHVAHGGKGYLDVIEDEIDNAGKEGFEQDVVNYSEYAAWMNGSFGAMLFPAFEQVRTAMFRTRSQIRALRIINALHAQTDAELKSVTPEYLIEIGVPESMTIDTMNGEPMKVKRVDERWVVYSVGTDLNDDGGDVHSQKDIGIGWVFD